MDALSPDEKSNRFRVHTLKFLLAGDPDVDKQGILAAIRESFEDSSLLQQGSVTAVVALMRVDGINVRAFFWDAAGQGRFNRIYENYSHGAQGIFLIYDITNRWSFESLDKWIKELDKSVPGVPRIMIGNKLHLAFNRTVSELEAEEYAQRHHIDYFEISTYCCFNVIESCWQLVRKALDNTKLRRSYNQETVPSLVEICARMVASRTTLYGLDWVDVPLLLRLKLKSYNGLHSTKRHCKCQASSYKVSNKRGRTLCQLQ